MGLMILLPIYLNRAEALFSCKELYQAKKNGLELWQNFSHTQ
jgi:hypothetical protein